MNNSSVSQWLQVSANVAILAGVILVILQMRQNAELLEFQILKQDVDGYIAAELALVGENYPDTWQKMLERPSDLSLAEGLVLEAILWGHMVKRWVSYYKLAEQGLIEDTVWRDEVDDDIGYELAHPYGRAWWRQASEVSSFPQELVGYINSKINSEQSPIDFYQRIDGYLAEELAKDEVSLQR